jgi:branched-chain amino acid transport system permease protein
MVTENLQILISGVALGCLFALLALGFVVVTKATGVLNLAQGCFVVLGAYLSYAAHQQWGLPFPLAVACSVAAVAAIAAAIEALIVHRVAGRQPYAPILVTFGILIVVPPVVAGIWGDAQLNLGDPWGLKHLQLGAVSITQRDVAVTVITGTALALFAGFFRFTRLGLAMRATASDPEAAVAQGISDRLVHRVAWAMAGALGALAGTMLATAAGSGVGPGLEHVAMLALPVIILGGLESPLGAVVAGLLLGVVQQFAVVRAEIGIGFYDVLPYLLMIGIMLVRPQGLFGTKRIRRI